MRLSHLYAQIVRFGRDRDPRKGRTPHAFEDSGILFGNPDTEVRKLLVGIDIEAPELLLAEAVRSREGLDLVMAHHPEGRPLAELSRVMVLQTDVLKALGVPEAVAREAMEPRIREVARTLLSGNHMRAVDAARLLQLPFMCVHTPADNHAAFFIEQLMRRKRPRTAQDIVDILCEVPEYRIAVAERNGPRIVMGNPRRPVGKICTDMTGGTEGTKEIYGSLRSAGVRTIVAMHLSEDHLRKVKEADLTVVVAGHISSDSLGVNLLLDRVEREGARLEVIECAGFRRVRRT